MKSRHWKKIGIIISFLAVAAFALTGCSGGSDGAAGAAGATGTTGPAGPVTLTSESCEVCHAAGRIAEFSDAVATTGHYDAVLGYSNVTISNMTVVNAGGFPKVSFNVKKGTPATPLTTLAFTELRFYAADLVPAATATVKYGTWGSPYFEPWASERSTTAGAAFNSTDAANGNYAITFGTAFGLTTPGATSGVDNSDYSATHVQRIGVRIGSNATNKTNGAAAVLDINGVPAVGAAAVAMDTQKQFVTVEACQKCHGARMAGAAHANGYVDTKLCVFCHTPLGGAAEEVYLPNFIHKIHAAKEVAAFKTRIRGNGYVDVTYPQEISNCVVCHTNSGKVLGTGDKIDNWKNNPTAEICGSCHTGANFTTGVGHVGGAQGNAQCAICHKPSGTSFAKSVTAAHASTVAAKDVPEYVATLSLTAPANGTHYVAGEAPMVTVTLKDYVTGAAVPSSVYTTKADTKGVAGGGLNAARIYVYGPRADARPVLTAGAAKTPIPTQSNNLFVGGTDAQVKTDATGFKYQLSAIPADMTAGTYMVRFYAADYGYVSDTDYRISSNVFKTIQIGTATVEKKIDGNACIDCHGTGNLVPHNARHSVVFNTDECLSCHDRSGNHADPIANRVHAVHIGSVTGDLLDIDWSAVTFPQLSWSSTTKKVTSIVCVSCHTSGSTAYRTNAFGSTCYGCHADNAGVKDHLMQNGAQF